MDLSRKLTVLGHPTPDKVNPGDKEQFRRLVVWLEDQKIRHMTIDERTGLRAIESNAWEKNFQSYLSKIKCPLGPTSPPHSLASWLLGLAVRLEFNESQQTENGTGPSKLDTVDCESKEFLDAVDTLANKLQIPWHPDPCVRLEAVTKLASTRLSKEALSKPRKVVPQGKPFPFREQLDSGLPEGTDEGVVEAAKILRLLHVHDLRQLQTSINECIVEVQKVTADPKTDTRLGKVGRT